MVWKCIYCCNPPKSVFTPLCHTVPPEAKLSDRQWECSNSLYSAFYPIIFLQKNTRRQSNKTLFVVTLPLKTNKSWAMENSTAACYPTPLIIAGCKPEKQWHDNKPWKYSKAISLRLGRTWQQKSKKLKLNASEKCYLQDSKGTHKTCKRLHKSYFQLEKPPYIYKPPILS